MPIRFVAAALALSLLSPQMTTATGTFDVKVTPIAAADNASDAAFGRYAIEKILHGDLEGTSRAEMLAFGTGAKGSSGGYVALERVSGTLHGRTGTFVLQHSSTMDRGAATMRITVVPDSGTGGLAGIAGTFMIDIKDGKHYYTFAYTLPAAP